MQDVQPSISMTARFPSVQYRAQLLALLLLGALAIAAVLGLTVGPVPIPAATALGTVGAYLTGTYDAADTTSLIILEIRLPRLFLGMMVGCSLAVSGVLTQGIFRNGLADPSLVGVSSGASLGAASMIVLKNSLVGDAASGPWLVATAAFAGGLLATGVVYRLSLRQRETSVTTMLLAGIAINALAMSGIGLFNSVADNEELRDLTFWTLGSLSGATWTTTMVVAPFTLFLLVVASRMSSPLDGLLLGEAEAHHIGVSVELVKRLCILTAAAAVGAAVAVSGLIFFVGLVVPHVIRLVAGPAHRPLVWGAAALGAVLLVTSDVVARTLIAPAELPIGIVTSFLGAPFFLVLLLRANRGPYA